MALSMLPSSSNEYEPSLFLFPEKVFGQYHHSTRSRAFRPCSSPMRIRDSEAEAFPLSPLFLVSADYTGSQRLFPFSGFESPKRDVSLSRPLASENSHLVVVIGATLSLG